MAPELVEGKRQYTNAIDVYALGVPFWEVWTEGDPYEELSSFQIYSAVREGKRPDLRKKKKGKEKKSLPNVTVDSDIESAVGSIKKDKTEKSNVTDD